MSKYHDIANRLEAFRKYKGWSKTLMAKECGVLPQNINRYLDGNSDPSKIAIKLIGHGLDIDWLLTGEGEMNVEEERASYENARKTALEQPSKGILHEQTVSWPPNGITKALGRAMCPPEEAILEGDDIIIDREADPKPGDLVLQTRDGYPKIERWHTGDPKPYAVCDRLMRNLRRTGK